MYLIEGRRQSYAWGSPTDIPELLGLPVTSQPYAEHWLGAHESAPSLIDGRPLDQVVAENPALLGDAVIEKYGTQLPYLAKLLAAAQPLSIQAHPDRAEAEAGFAQEDEAGVPLDAPERTYRDTRPKPEAIVAITEFQGLCGFREAAETADLFEALEAGDEVSSLVAPLTQRRGSAAMAEVFLDVLSLDGDRLNMVNTVVEAARQFVERHDELGVFARTAVELDAAFPGDRGILAGLLLNRFTLTPGEGIFLPPGNLHAYLSGFGFEVMANSDNVLRGGLTVKHIDVDALLSVVSFVGQRPELMWVDDLGGGIHQYRTHVDEFSLWRVDLTEHGVELPGIGPRITVTVDGTARLLNGDSLLLPRGQAAFVGADETVRLEGEGSVFVVGPGGFVSYTKGPASLIRAPR